MKIAGIDVGINNLGIAFFSSSLEKTFLFTETSKDSVEKRLYHLFTQLDTLFTQEFNQCEKNNYLVYEIPYFSFNSKTGKLLDYVVGGIHILAAKHNLKLRSYTAKEIKKAINVENCKEKKSREENKILVKNAVENILKLDLSNLSDHELDSIAAILCFKNKEGKN